MYHRQQTDDCNEKIKKLERTDALVVQKSLIDTNKQLERVMFLEALLPVTNQAVESCIPLVPVSNHALKSHIPSVPVSNHAVKSHIPSVPVSNHALKSRILLLLILFV